MLSALLAGALIAAASLFLGAAVMAARRPAPPFARRSRRRAVGAAGGLRHRGQAARARDDGRDRRRPDADRGRRRPGAKPRADGHGADRGGASRSPRAALVISIPFVASGRVGILGQGLINDDMASHLLFTEWVDTRAGPTPDLVAGRLPAGSARDRLGDLEGRPGADLIETFAGLTGAIAVLAALTAYGALGGVRAAVPRSRRRCSRRCPTSARPTSPRARSRSRCSAWRWSASRSRCRRCASSWNGQQPTYVSTLPDRGRGWMKRQALLAIPAGVIAAGTIYNYSFPGLAWLADRGRSPGRCCSPGASATSARGCACGQRLRWAPPVLVAGVAIPVIAALPELVNIVELRRLRGLQPLAARAATPASATCASRSTRWRRSASGPPASSGSRREQLEHPGARLLRWAACSALAAFVWGLGRALARREAALPAALAAGGDRLPRGARGRHALHAAKALAVAAPVVMLIALRGLLARRPARGRGARAAGRAGGRRSALRPLVRFGVPALTAAFALAAAFSTLLPLRQSAGRPGQPRRRADGRCARRRGRRGRALPRPRQLHLVGAARLRGLHARSSTTTTPRRSRSLYRATADQRQVRLGQRAADAHRRPPAPSTTSTG